MRRVGRFGIRMIAVGVTLLALASGVSAVPVVLDLTGPIQGNTLGPQSTSNPCIIAGTQCQQQPPTMGFNNFTQSGAISSYNMFSTTPTANIADGVQGNPYTVAQLEGAVGSSFVVAIDVNTNRAASETLQLFEVIVNDVVEYNYIGPTVIGGIANNGKGFADWTLGVVDLSSFPDNATVLFHAQWNNAVAGAESFFLISSPTTVSEPGTLLLLGSGLVGLAAFARIRLHS
jgi:hypothetical protein